MSKYLINDHRIFDAGDHFDGATAFTARFDIDLEHTSSPKQTLKHLCLESPERLRPANGLEHRNGSYEYISAYCTAAQILKIGEKATAAVNPIPAIHIS